MGSSFKGPTGALDLPAELARLSSVLILRNWCLNLVLLLLLGLPKFNQGMPINFNCILGKQIHLVVYHHSYPFKGVAEFRPSRHSLFRKSFSTRPFLSFVGQGSLTCITCTCKKVSFELSAVLPFQKLRAEFKRQKHLCCRKLIISY